MLQDEYVKAYYAALLERQREQEAHDDSQQQMSNASTSNGVAMPTERQVGMKSKLADEYEGDDVEWDEEPPAGTVNRHFILKQYVKNIRFCLIGSYFDLFYPSSGLWSCQ